MTDVTSPGAGQGGPPGVSFPRVGRRAYLEETVAHLFVTSSGISVAGRSMAMLPTASNPSLAVPRRPRRAAATAVRLYKSSAGRGTRLGLEVLAAGLQLGAVDLLPRLRLDGAAARSGAAGQADLTGGGADVDIVELLSAHLGQEVHIAVYSSAPRANRKPVLHVFDRLGRPLAYVKIGNTRLSSQLVVREGETLASLRHVSLPHVVMPELIVMDRWRDMDVMVVEPVRFSSGRPSEATLVEAMREVAQIGGVASHELAVSPYLAELRARMAAVPTGDAATALAHQLDQLGGLASRVVVSLGSWHGDWTPWNCSRAGRRVGLWDWERFVAGVPVGFDRLHYALQDRVVRRKETAPSAASALLRDAGPLLDPFGVRRDDALTVARLYLVELGVRYLLDRQDRTGGPLGDVGAWLVPALRESMEGPVRTGPS